MDNLTCIIVDDESLAPELLADYIAKIPYLLLTGIYTDPLEALSVVQRQKIDLVFLDIRMPVLNGIQFMQLLNGRSKVVIVSAFPDFALQGYDLDVVDYLVKPVSFERFLKATGKAWMLVSSAASAPASGVATASQPLTVAPVAGQSAWPADQVLFVKTDYKIVRVMLPEILFIEGLKEYIAIHTGQGKVVTLQTMKKMQAVLPGHTFTRVHKSFIVAIDKIDSIERSHILIGNHRIPVGEVYKEEFLRLLDSRNLL